MGKGRIAVAINGDPRQTNKACMTGSNGAGDNGARASHDQVASTSLVHPQDRLTFLGHATVLVELDGLRLLTDPVLRQVVGPLWRRAPKPHLGPLTGLDAILISHLHLDHYDPPSLRLLDKGVPIIGPPGSARALRWRGFAEVHELAPGESLSLGSVEITATDAKHPSGRHPWNRTPSVGYVISGSQDIYFAGDTGLFPGMADLWGDLDIALLPIAGLGPFLPEFKHLSPRHAVRAMELLRPNLVIPIHWGTYHLPGTALMRMRPDIHREAPLVFMREAAALEPDIRTVMLEPGQSLDLERQIRLGSLRRGVLAKTILKL
jgi:L-ascorbate metabolism protein UlaG (beta-lactamase superfamily)